ncbi:pancreatic secretory granule membrane major glycoprotein GP2-like [Lepus europaeus]|uniref:pancreatic secretory granule membrane major glycoprotein GP2-like n=1 Tax=Lepus europaeus TaxID=9983 RepID=UPI002B45BE82|nr:pancreatic secretory granule membrane major glycoprotein GP2-like [Lepus europaeus]
MVGSDLLWLALASCTLTLACALQQGNRSPREIHSPVQYLSCGDPGTPEADACFDPCENYEEINDTTRSTEFKAGTKKNVACDNDLSGWYRFVGGGGVQMPISCVPMFRCQADAPVWMYGDHPNVEDGIVNRTACAHWAENCCFWQLVVQVKACPGGYYVYQLEGTPTCNLRYCSEHCEKTCLPGEECQYRDGAWGCFCTRNLSDSDIEKLKPELECGVTEITLSTRKSLLEGLCLGENVTGYLLDRDCSSIQQKEDSDWINVTVPLQASDCGFTVEGNDTRVIYKNTLSFVNDLTNSDTTLIINFQCTYLIHINASLPIALKPIESSTTIYVEGEGVTGKEEFSVVMALFKDEDYTDPYVGDVIELPVDTILYVSIKLVERDHPYLLLWSCHATPTADRDDDWHYFFIEEGLAQLVNIAVKNQPSARPRWNIWDPALCEKLRCNNVNSSRSSTMFFVPGTMPNTFVSVSDHSEGSHSPGRPFGRDFEDRNESDLRLAPKMLAAYQRRQPFNKNTCQVSTVCQPLF